MSNQKPFTVGDEVTVEYDDHLGTMYQLAVVETVSAKVVTLDTGSHWTHAGEPCNTSGRPWRTIRSRLTHRTAAHVAIVQSLRDMDRAQEIIARFKERTWEGTDAPEPSYWQKLRNELEDALSRAIAKDST